MVNRGIKSSQYARLKIVGSKKAQTRIQQMAFMIVGLLFFFILVALFFLAWQYKSLRSGYELSQKDQAISSLKVISGMVELNCDSSREFCMDEDKLEIMSKKDYSQIWPVASIRVLKVYPAFTRIIKCPAQGCNEYVIYDSGQSGTKEFSTYVSICKNLKENTFPYERCEIGKLLVGVKLIS
jgi:hypothetical protein